MESYEIISEFPNRRKYPRMEDPVRYFCWSRNLILMGELKDIGLRGVFIKSRIGEPVGTMVKMRFDFPDNAERIVALGEVVRCEKGTGIAVRFNYLSHNYRAYLAHRLLHRFGKSYFT